jgi:hypothetical protein
MSNRYGYLLIWHMPVAVCTVLNSWWWTERPSETCRAFHKNKYFEKQVHLVGIIIGIYYDARTYERQNVIFIFHASVNPKIKCHVFSKNTPKYTNLSPTFLIWEFRNIVPLRAMLPRYPKRHCLVLKDFQTSLLLLLIWVLLNKDL